MNGAQLHGPYWQWTRKVDGRTVTRRVPAEQAARFQSWVDDARRLREALRALEEASAAAAEDDLRG
jgi:hypothetical protein